MQRQGHTSQPYHRRMAAPRPLAGTRTAITRPAGTATALARRIAVLGGVPLLLPGSSLRPPSDPEAARAALQAALGCDFTIFTSPAAVRFVRRLGAPRACGRILAPGTGTLRALHRAGFTGAAAPAREDSEGLLGLPELEAVAGKHIGIVGAAGGRGLLDTELTRRGASVAHAHVYRRAPARLDRRHAEALLADAARPLYVLLSSGEALANVLTALPAAARHALLGATAVVSSQRLAGIARNAGFTRVLRADAPHAEALLGAVIADRAGGGPPATMAPRK